MPLLLLFQYLQLKWIYSWGLRGDSDCLAKSGTAVSLIGSLANEPFVRSENATGNFSHH